MTAVRFNDVDVELKNVEKSYRKGTTVTPVLRSLNLSVRRGECVFLAGPSGSGKSTALSIIGCMLSPDGGSVRLLGHDSGDFRGRQLAEFRRDYIGFVFQRFQLIRGLNALENVCLPLILAKKSRRKAVRRAELLLDSVGLGDKASSHPHNLSTGQCQRVAVARALANDPALLLADEPTASLDAENGHRTLELLRDLASQHQKTIIVVTHDSRIFKYADRIYGLDDGQARELTRVEANPDATVMPIASVTATDLETAIPCH